MEKYLAEVLLMSVLEVMVPGSFSGKAVQEITLVIK
jgi:hypothetical protein